MNHETTRSQTSRSSSGRALGAIAALAIAGIPAGAQSIIGDTFDWQFGESTSSFETGSLTISGQGPFETLDLGEDFFLLSFEPTAIIITTSFVNEPDISVPIGTLSNGSDDRFKLTGLDFDSGDEIVGIQVSGTVGAAFSDVSFTSDSITIGSSVPGEPLEFENGDTLRIDLITDPCAGDSILNPRTGDRFSSIQAAIDAAADGDVIELGPCDYNETGIEIFNRVLTIVGRGPELTAIDPQSQPGIPIDIRSGSDVVLEGLTIQNGFNPTREGALRVVGSQTRFVMRRVHVQDCRSDDSAMSVAGATVEIVDSLFRGNEEIASVMRTVSISFGTGTTATVRNTVFAEAAQEAHQVDVVGFASGSESDVKFVNCTFAAFDGISHISYFGDGVTSTISNCVIAGGANPFETDPRAAVTFDHSVLPVLVPGTGNFAATPSFVDPANGDFRLAAGSAGIDMGDLGAYVAVSGGFTDIAGDPRVLDDPGTANTGPNPLAAIDAGAFEFQGETVPLPGDFNGDGVVDFIDVVSLAFTIEAILP